MQQAAPELSSVYRLSAAFNLYSLGRFVRFDVDGDGDFFAHHSGSLDRFAPVQAVVGAFNWIGCDLPAADCFAAHSFSFAQELGMERDLFCHPVHREVADDVATFSSGLLHTLALESDRREFRHFEKIWTTQVFIALVVFCVDARHVDRRRDRGFLRMIHVHMDRAFEFLEVARHKTKEVPHFKADRGMDRIDLVSLIRGRAQGAAE